MVRDFKEDLKNEIKTSIKNFYTNLDPEVLKKAFLDELNNSFQVFTFGKLDNVFKVRVDIDLIQNPLENLIIKTINDVIQKYDKNANFDFNEYFQGVETTLSLEPLSEYEKLYRDAILKEGSLKDFGYWLMRNGDDFWNGKFWELPTGEHVEPFFNFEKFDFDRDVFLDKNGNIIEPDAEFIYF